MGRHPLYNYTDESASIVSNQANLSRTIYFPLCGPSAGHLKSSITPYLCGDLKIDKDRYVTKPVSTEDLRQPLRNFYLTIDKEVFAVTSPYNQQTSTQVEAGLLWHKVTKKDADKHLSVEFLNLIPVTGENVELMRISVTNESDHAVTITPTVAVPIFARALSNKHDHEHVTSLLNRIKQIPQGVAVCPTMRFNEEGHQPNNDVYFVFGVEDNGQPIVGSFPTVNRFCGLNGDYHAPQALLEHKKPSLFDASDIQGKEAVGALMFHDAVLQPNESKSYYCLVGVGKDEEETLQIYGKYCTPQQFEQTLKQNKKYWTDKTESIVFLSGDNDFNAWMRWVVLQPVLRRIFGCSFLPDHDYGKGGKGWRDIWQDLLSLILIEPQQVKDTLINNFGGVRIDGSNATIIGAKPGEFVADRNAIARVWMDHGAWPLITLVLYIHQTGDYDILLEDTAYYKDNLQSRTVRKDRNWDPSQSSAQMTADGKLYKGSVIEHLLIQQLVQFFNVGEHNIIRLENADWNDGLDMAFARGESVAFTSLYAGNLFQLADLLEQLSDICGIKELNLAKEMGLLLDTLNDPVDYQDIRKKQARLFDEYFPSVEPTLSGEKKAVCIKDIVADLRQKSQWIFDHVRQHEKVMVDNNAWFNGYYDNQGQQVEGMKENNVRMTLTGQVFPIMSGLANEKEIAAMVQSVNTHLKDKSLGGYRLNSDFKVPHYLDLGRAFGFAFGAKENGAFFSHMIVMYAYGLYKRGFAREGYDVLQSIYKMCMDTDKSNIYPGIPEYIDSQGRGMYHYLTGSASWLVLTMLTQVYGVVGRNGHLTLSPKLVKEEFNTEKKAGVTCYFADKKVLVEYLNESFLDYDEYNIIEVFVDGMPITLSEEATKTAVIDRKIIEKASPTVNILVKLG